MHNTPRVYITVVYSNRQCSIKRTSDRNLTLFRVLCCLYLLKFVLGLCAHNARHTPFHFVQYTAVGRRQRVLRTFWRRIWLRGRVEEARSRQPFEE